MSAALRIAMQLLLYLPLMLLIGWFSNRPVFTLLEEDQALLRLSFTHAAERREPCRERNAAELEKMAPNMRAPLECPRARAPMRIELELDGRVVLRRDVAPTGLQNDGAATVSQRIPVASGRHRIVVRLRDRAQGDFNYVAERTLDLAPGAMLVIDFAASKGGFLFRG